MRRVWGLAKWQFCRDETRDDKFCTVKMQVQGMGFSVKGMGFSRSCYSVEAKRAVRKLCTVKMHVQTLGFSNRATTAQTLKSLVFLGKPGPNFKKASCLLRI